MPRETMNLVYDEIADLTKEILSFYTKDAIDLVKGQLAIEREQSCDRERLTTHEYVVFLRKERDRLKNSKIGDIVRNLKGKC